MQDQAIVKLKNNIKDIIARHLDVNIYTVFFFGSRIDGSARERSDIDVGIEGPNIVPLLQMAKIRNDIDELSTLLKIDVVDFKTVSPVFYSIAKQHINITHEQTTSNH